MITNKYNNISSQDALFNNVTIRDTIKSDSIEANEIVKSLNPESTGRIILNGTLTVSGNDNSIDTIKNVNITNNELQFTNESGTTTANKITQENGMTNITGGNITFNHTLEVTGENHDITTISDANMTNNKEMNFTNENGNTTIDNITGESTITKGDISFNNVVTVKNEQDNQNNITSIINSNITNNNLMSFTNETANTTIDTLQKGEGDLTITGGNININNIITVTDESIITSLTNANVTNSGTITLNNASIDRLITSNINGPKTLNDSLKETKFKYKEETLKKSTDNVIGTKYYNIPYVKEVKDTENNDVTYYGELVNKSEELDESNNDYDMKYYYADIIYYLYHNKIIIPDGDTVDVKKADQISLIDADVTNNGTLNITDGSVIQEIIGDVKFSGKVNLEAVTEIRDVDNIILEDAIITNNKGITITGESTISSITNSNIGGNVTINTTDKVSIDNITNSTITDGTVTINGNITSTVTNSNLIGGTVKLGENKTLTVDVKEGTLENEIIKTITDSTINNANVTLNNNITSTVTNSDLNATTIDLNSNTLTTKEGEISSFDNINNSTITNGNVTINNNLESLLTNAVLGDNVNNNVNINLNKHSLIAETGSSVSNINNSTLTNGTLTINNDITSKVINSNINNGTVDLNNHKLTANGDITLINITGGNITNTGTIEAKGTITASQINSNLLKDQTGTNQIMAYDKDNKKITFCNHTTLTCSGEEDTLTTDNLVIDRITLNEVREVDGGIITTGLKVGFPYWVDLGTDAQESTINIQGNILHIVQVTIDGNITYHLWISMMDIEFSLKSTETKIISKGSTYADSVLINSLDDLQLGTNEHLYIQTKEETIATGKMLNDMVINAEINNLGVITGKSLQSNQLSNEDGNKSLIKYDSANNKITLGDSNAELEIIGFDQKNIVCDTLKTNDHVMTDLIKSLDDTLPLLSFTKSTNTITIGNDLTTQTTDNLSTTNLNVSNYIYSNKLYSISKLPLLSFSSNYLTIGSSSSDYKYTLIRKIRSEESLGISSIYYWSSSSPNVSLTIPLLVYDNTNSKVVIGSASTNQETNNLTVTTNLKVANRIYADNIYSSSSIGYPLIRFETTSGLSTTSGVLLGNLSSGKNNIYHSIVYDLYSYTRNRQIFGEASDSNVIDNDKNTTDNFVFFGNSDYAYTLIHNLRTNTPLYAPSIYYWPENTAKSSAVPLLDYTPTPKTITLGDADAKVSIPSTLITESIKDSENDSIISVDTETDIITIGNDNKQTIIKNVDYSDIFNKIYVSMEQNIKFKIDPKIAIDKAIKTVDIATITVTKGETTTTISNVTAYQNADNIYNNYTTGQIFLNRLSTSTDTTTEVDVYIIPKKRNFFNYATNTGAFYTKQTARMCFVFCNLYFIIKSPKDNDETSSGLWISSNGNVWHEFSPKDFNNKTGPYSDATVTGAKFDISQTKTINNLSIGYIPRGWMVEYEQYEDHYVLGFPLITVSNEAYYAAFLLYDYDEYMTREVTYDGGCTIL